MGQVRKLLWAVSVGTLLSMGPCAWAQASEIPSAAPGPSVQGDNKGRALLDLMATALGGDAWRNRVDWKAEGSTASFYKGQPNLGVGQFEEYYRAQPFGERIVFVSKNANPLSAMVGVPVGKTKRDLALVWTPEMGYEVTFRGKKELPAEDVQDFEQRRRHSIDTIMREWLKEPGVSVTYEGTSMVERRIADQVTVINSANDAVTLQLDATTHLPLSRTFRYRDPQFKDFNTDVEQYDTYQPFGGVQTPMSVTRLKNGDMVSQRFLTRVTYNQNFSADLFDPNRPLERKAK